MKSLCLFLLLNIISGQSMQVSLSDLMPGAMEGWQIEGEDTSYGPKNLYEYIDGGAELFLSFGFRQVRSRIYTAPDQPDIIVDIFDMGSSQNAYGVFSHSRETEDTTFGQGSQYDPGLILFWKDRFYVSILFTPETEKARDAAFRIARHIEQKIPRKGELPQILKFLPPDSLLKETIRYFHHYIWLNSYHFVSNENILHIQDDTDAVLAKYAVPGGRSLLLLIRYPDRPRALRAYDDFVAAYLPALSERVVAANESGKWVGCQLYKEYLIIVLESPHRETALDLLSRVRKQLGHSMEVSP